MGICIGGGEFKAAVRIARNSAQLSLSLSSFQIPFILSLSIPRVKIPFPF